MDITVRQENLQRALTLIERVTTKNAALPILSNILLQTEGGRLKLTATNLEVGMTSTIGAKVQKEGRVAVPGRIIADLARAAQAETISLSVKQNVMTMVSGSYHTSLLCFDAGEYPIVPNIGKGMSFTVDIPLFRNALIGIADSIAVSDARPELSGAFIQFQKHQTLLAATDSFRLVECGIPTSNSQEAACIVPRGTILELLRTLTDAQGELTVRVADNQAAFTHEYCEVISRLIDGRYPDYQKFIPERFISKVLVRREEFMQAIKVAALFSSTISDVKIECHEGGMDVSAKNASKGEGKASVKTNLKGEPFEIALNYHYLLDGLKVMPGDTVIAEFTSKGSPFVLRPGDGQTGCVYLVMPLRG